MKISKKIAILSLFAILLFTAIVGCAPSESLSPSVSDSNGEEQQPTPTLTPTPTPSEDPDIIPVDAHYVVKEGSPCITFVYSDDTTDRVKSAYQDIQQCLREKCNVNISSKSDTQLSKVTNENFFVGTTKKTNISVLSEFDATWYDCLLTQTDDGLLAIAYTNGGIINALEHFKESLIFTSDNKNVYFMPETLKLYERDDVSEVTHAFDEFTISGYGSPKFSAADPDKWNEQDWKTYQSMIDFGVTHLSIDGWNGIPNDSSVEDTRKYIEKLYEAGITTRYYFSWNIQWQEDYIKYGEEKFIKYGKNKDLENAIKQAIANYGDMEAVTEWGFYDEPHFTDEKKFCGYVMRLFDEYDTSGRRVYINMDPSNDVGYFEQMIEYVDPDYFCYDRYPFFYNDDGEPQMTDTYWYANLELNRDYALDAGKDAGIIIGSIVVGCDPRRSEVTQEYMNWQVNTMLAYHFRYLEHFVFYSGHGCGLYTNENDPTFRWYYAQNVNKYAMTVGTMLLDKRLDAVFHLQNADGSYSPQTVAYQGFKDIGDVIGCDAFLSFFDDGTIIITDKRSAPADGSAHDVTISGLNGVLEWFNADNNAWEDISTCTAAAVDENGLTLTLEMATQYIVREKQ